MIAAVDNMRQLKTGQDSAIRWLIDSRSCLQALEAPFLKHGEQVTRLRSLLQEIANLGIHLEAAWVPSHCGLPENEEADRIASNGLHRHSLIWHHAVPISLRTLLSIVDRTGPADIVQLPEVPRELGCSRRHAELRLHQLMCDSFPNAGAFYGSQPRDPICNKCSHLAQDTVDHIMMRCPGKQVSRRKYLGGSFERSVYDLCKTKPIQVLEHLNSEGLL